MKINKIIKSNIVKKEGLVTTVAVILSCIVLAVVFPAENLFQILTIMLVFLVILPILYIKGILKRDVKDFGLSVGDPKAGFIWVALGYILFGLLIYGAIMYTNIESDYKELIFIKRSFATFVVYYMGIGVTMIMTEFFFRGFVLNYLKEIFLKKYYAIFAQAIIFFIFVSMFERFSFDWNVVFQLIVTLFAGVIAYKSRSIVYSYLFSLIVIIILGVSIIKVGY